MFVQAHAFVLAEGDGQPPLCMVPRAQRSLSQVLKMPRSLVLQPRLSAVPLVSRTSRGELGHPVRACLRPASEGMQADGLGICRGTAEGEVSNMPCSWCSRKHPFSSRNTEVGYVVLPTSRTKISLRPRPAGTAGSAAGEDNSSFTSYTGITMVRRNRLKLISPEEKGKIFSDEVNPLPIKWRKRGPRGVPLFWCESKSVTAWEQILQDTMTQAVVDLSPGSGALAEACMKMGAQYFGIVFDKTHHQWLTNVVDRASLQYICAQGGQLYHSDLATTLKELFSDQMDKDDNDDGTGDLSDEDDAGGEELV